MVAMGAGDEGNRRVNEHIGPVQVNVGGIQVDSEDMLRSRTRSPERPVPSTTPAAPGAASAVARPSTPGLMGEGAGASGTSTPSAVASPDGKAQNEALDSFFAGLMKRGTGNSAANSPRGPAS